MPNHNKVKSIAVKMKIEQNFRFRQKKNKKNFRRIYGEEARFFESNENKNLNVRIEWREF